MPYVWVDNTLMKIYQVLIVLAAFFIIRGALFFDWVSMLLGLFCMVMTFIVMLFDKQQKIENIIEKAVKKAKTKV